MNSRFSRAVADLSTPDGVATDQATLTALGIAGWYLLFAIIWILGSDGILNLLTSDHAEYSRYQTYKGSVFVAATAFLILGLVRRPLAAMREARDAAHRSADHLLISQQHFRGIYENALACIFIVDWDGHIEHCNSAACRLLGYAETELIGAHFSTIIHPDDRQSDLEQARRLRSGALSSFQVESRYVHKNGEPIWVRKIISTLPAAEPDRAKVFALAIDLTESRLATQAMRDSEQRFKLAMAATGEGLWDWSVDTNLVTHNGQWCRLLGLDDSYLVHPLDYFIRLVHADDQASVRAAIDSCLEGAGAYKSQHRMRHADGTYIWVEDRGDVVERDSGGRALRMVGSLADITARMTAQAEADRQRGLFQSVFQSSPDGMILTDTDRNIVNINPAFTVMFGYGLDDLRGKSTRCLYTSEEAWLAASTQISQGACMVPAEHGVRKDGEVFPCQVTAAPMRDASGALIGYVGIVRDVSVERRRELALREKQRLESLGRLTGGIAHDFNNLLTVIRGNLQLMEMDLDDDRPRKPLEAALRATEMGERLNKRLMTFARQRRLAPVPSDLNLLLHSMLDLVRRSMGESVAVETRLVAGAPVVSIDPSELENAILNLALNARDAMPDGGRLLLETDFTEVGSDDVSLMGGLSPGHYVRLSATDTGEGMSPEVLSRAFEPFFTTKQPGKGSGLGLTSLFGFVRLSGGHVSLYSEVGHGTTVNIYLPRLEAGQRAEKNPASASIWRHGAGEKILLVEDHADVRSITAERLKLLGYRVVEADTGAAALEILDTGAVFDLVLSDIVMPGGVSGVALAQRVKRLLPQAGLLLTSGFPDEFVHLDHAEVSAIPILRKPYGMAELASAVRQGLKCDPPRADEAERAPSPA